MPASVCFKPVHLSPITGFMDTRSLPDEVPRNGYRYVSNMRVTTKHRMCRAPGFRKLLSQDTGYNNQDLHDQLFGNTRQYFTLGFQAESPAGFTKLFVGTQNRIYALNNSTGNWKIISDKLGGAPEAGCSERRFKAASLQHHVIFTNNFDRPVYHIIDQPAIEPDQQSVKTIPDLDELEVTKVGLVISWNNLMFLANLFIGGERSSNRVIWSDYKRPLSYLPQADVSIAGSFDFDSGEIILAAAPLMNSLLFYTNKHIWEAVIGDSGPIFRKRYTPDKPGERCIAYPNTLVSDGESHYFWATDGIYAFNFYRPHPELVEWIHRASSLIFEDINITRCNAHVGAYHSDAKEIWWSWAKAGQNCPTDTFVINTQFPFSYFTGNGFSMLMTYEPDPIKSLRDFILENCICTQEEMDSFGAGFIKEGAYCATPTVMACEPRPQNFHSSQALTQSLVDGDITSENYLIAPDADALSSLLSNVTVESICGDEWSSDACNADKRFIMASVDDQCLKESADVYYRERCIGFDACGLYDKPGYRSLLRSGALHLDAPDDDKLVQRFAMEYLAAVATVPAQVILRIGIAAQAIDPNSASGRCVILWTEEEPKKLECLSDVDAATHTLEGTMPAEPMEWGLYQQGHYLYYELEIVNNDVTPKDTGGAVCMSRFTFDAAYVPRCLP